MAELIGLTPDIATENIERLKEIFPDVFAEGRIDFDKLKQDLGEYVDDNKERYNFTWNGKGRALRLAQTPSTGTLRPCVEESKDWDITQNLYIEGDNLEVLKLLQKSYHGKVKMIYIDPPYNTGGDFVYLDDFSDSIENYKRITGQVDDEGKKISTNSEASGRYHTDWLNMMYPRLRLARNLLSDDGIVFISIDDNEVTNLKLICDEIFGADNFVAQLVWQNKTGAGAKSKGFIGLHEYILCYTKNLDETWDVYAPLSEKMKAMYNKTDQYADILGPYATWPLDTTSMGDRPNLRFPIIHNGQEIWPLKQWLWSKERVFKAQEEGKLVFNFNERLKKWTVRFKGYLYDNTGEIKLGKPTTIYTGPYTQEGTKDFSEFFPRAVFDFPKPVELLKELLSITVGGITSDDIVLDFFSGSAATAQAIMELNVEDGYKRKFVLVQLPEQTDKSGEAFKAGYKNICEIGKERIRRAGEKIKEEAGLLAQTLDIGFKVLRLDSSNLCKWQPDYDNLEQSLLDNASNFVDGRTEIDVVYEIMLKMGLDLTYPVEEHTVSGKNVYTVGFGALMMCLDNDITTEIASGMVQFKNDMKPETWKVVFKDNGFSNDSVKTNVKEILKCAGLDEGAFTTV